MGMLELEVLLGRWSDENIEKMGLPELRQFTSEVLEKEITELDGFFLKGKEIPEGSRYPEQIKNYIQRNKA